jgi:hypothetical protein
VPEATDEVEEGGAMLRQTDEIRTMLTSLLDCGDELCRQIVRLIRKKDLNVVTHVADIVGLFMIF